MRVVGTGLIGSAFSSCDLGVDVSIFASGVSNSRETDPHAFERERSLLSGCLRNNRHLIYFSTCSITDAALAETNYVKHKVSMENMVLARDGGIVIRLPQVVGRSLNKNTLTNFLAWKIYKQESYILHLGSVRNLIDIDDVVYLTKKLIQFKWQKRLVSFALPISHETKDIVKSLEDVLNLQSKHQTMEVCPVYYPPSNFINYVIERGHYDVPDNYLYKVIKKYYADFPMGFV